MQQSDQIGMFHDGPSDLQLARELSATIGREFFDVMVKHLAHALTADCVCVGEFGGPGGECVSTLAACTDGKADSFQYDLPGSATEQIAYGHPVECQADARSRYPSDGMLARLRAQACAGIPLRDSQGHPFGVLMAVYRQPTANLQVQKLHGDRVTRLCAFDEERTGQRIKTLRHAERITALL
jgi:hypothetical protein